MNITISLTDVQVRTLLQYAVIRILEDHMEREIDKEIAKQHAADEDDDQEDFGHP